MRNINDWLEEYGESHQNPTNKAIHWVCVPLILISLLGLLSSLWFPGNISFTLFDIPVPLSWSIVLIAIATIFYVSLSFSLTIGMLVISIIIWFLFSNKKDYVDDYNNKIKALEAKVDSLHSINNNLTYINKV